MSRPYLSVSGKADSLMNCSSFDVREGRQKGRAGARPVVSFPSTGGVDVSLHTLGPARAGHRRRSPGYSGRPRRSETVLRIIDAPRDRSDTYKNASRRVAGTQRFVKPAEQN